MIDTTIKKSRNVERLSFFQTISTWRGTRDRSVAVSLVIFALILRTWQYAAGTSLWLDEIRLAGNVLGRSFHDLLLKPLDYDQVAPPGFLFLEKLATLAFGGNEYALRFAPFAASVIATFVFWRVAEESLDGVSTAVAMVLFASNIGLIRYTAEAKQYGLDVTAALALTLAAMRARARGDTTPRPFVVGAAAWVFVWFSQTTVFALAGVGAALIVCWFIERPRRSAWPIVITLMAWITASIAAIVVAVRYVTPATAAFMSTFWREGFVPWPPVHVRDTLWLWDRLVDLFGNQLMLYPWPAVYVLLMIAGFVDLWRRRHDVALILMGPCTMTVVAAVAHQYPFSRRLILFLVPALLIAVASGIGWTYRKIAVRSQWCAALVVILVAAAPLSIVLSMPPPYRVEEYKKTLAYVMEHRNPGDPIYVFTSADAGIRYYAGHYPLGEQQYTYGGCYRDDVRPYLREVDRYRGTPRLWVILASTQATRPVRITLTRYLDTIGVRKDGVAYPSSYGFSPDGTFAYLYDLSDTRRLTTVSAASVPVEPMLPDLRPPCQLLATRE